MNGHPIDIGTVFGTYTVVGTEKDNKNKTKYILQCSCGNIAKKIGFEVRKNKKCQKCGLVKLIGTKNYKTTFLSYIGNARFECLCDCGEKFIARSRNKSCGCHKQESIIKSAQQLEGLKDRNVKILSFSHLLLKPNRKMPVYKARCRCGNIFQIKRCNIGYINSCGCRKFSKHRKGQEQGSSKHTNNQVKASIDLYLSGQYSKQEICNMTDISPSTLECIISNRGWKHIEVDKQILSTSPKKHTFRKTKKTIPILPNQQFNSWTVIRQVQSKHKRRYFLCQCKCGFQSDVPATQLTRNGSKQCKNCSFDYFVSKRYRSAPCI